MKTKIFVNNFNKTRQTLSDVILVDVSQLANGPKELISVLDNHPITSCLHKD